MQIGPGSKVGPYEVVAPLGAGGMGEVWRGHDARLGRDVAIKVLPAALAADAERRARFERECRLLASLGHPHIAAVLGLEDAGGTPALVMELVEGPTLAERLGAGAFELDEALVVARQIAEAVEFAHERGIVHRDLKPGNVKLTADGAVKVLDFGLAKALAAEDGSAASAPQITQSPTMSVGTQAGVLLGTAAYMAPEQARGKAVDRRADIWAFGVVVFEMLSGRQLFAGETVSDTIARILERQPDWSALPARTPDRVRELLRRCLDKDARQRLRDIGDARIELDAVIAARAAGDSGVGTAAAGATRERAQKQALGVVAVALVTGALALAGGFALRGVLQPRTPLHLSVVPPDDIVMNGIQFGFGDDRAMYASGTARIADSPAASAIYRRTFDDWQWKKIPGTEGRISWDLGMDGRWVYVLRAVAEGSRQRELVRVPTDGSTPPAVVMPIPSDLGSWDMLPDGRALVFDGEFKRFAALAPGASGEPDWKPVKTDLPIAQLTAHECTPDGKGALLSVGYYRAQAWMQSAAYFDVATGEIRVLEENVGTVALLARRYLLMSRGGALLAAPWDASRHRLAARPATVLQGLRINMAWEHGRFTASERGDLSVTLGGVTSQSRKLAIVHADGRVEPWNGDERPFVITPEVSPDGRFALTTAAPPGGSVFELLQLERGRPGVRRIAGLPTADCASPAYSRDGKWIAWSAMGDSASSGLYVQPVDGSAPARRVLASGAPPDAETACDWMPDHRSIVVVSRRQGRTAIRRVTLEGTGVSERDMVGAVDYAQAEARVSPDGGRLAWVSFENGTPTVVVAAIGPDGRVGTPVPASNGFGQSPRWADDRTLLWATRAGLVMASQVSPALDVSAPVRRADLSAHMNGAFDFALMPGGDLLITKSGPDEGEVRHLEIALGFEPELKRLIAKANGGR
ncbi:MAG: protein kinase [Candidatus Eisenbacteria bacterium]